MVSRRRRTALWVGAAFLVALVVSRPRDAESERKASPRPGPRPGAPPVSSQDGFAWPRSLALAFVAIFLFAAGAALGGAFTAAADEGAALAGAATDAAITDDATTTAPETVADETTTDAVTTEPALDETTTAPPPAETTPVAEPPAPSSGGGDDGSNEGTPPSQPEETPSAAPHSASAASHEGHVKRAPEIREGSGAVIWLHRVLPDPTPPARRLSPHFAELLRATAKRNGVHWPLMLAVLRADGHGGRFPASRSQLESLATDIQNGAVVRSRQVAALALYNRAVGLRALVTGLEAAKPRLERRVLRDARISIYDGGRADIIAGRVDVRVLVTIRYLAIAFKGIQVSSLISGHRFFARPGVMSAHVDGLAVDIAALGGRSITGNQAPGGLTERAVEALLGLPVEVQPQQIISLLGLGGRSIALADHYDHIHVGF